MLGEPAVVNFYGVIVNAVFISPN